MSLPIPQNCLVSALKTRDHGPLWTQTTCCSSYFCIQVHLKISYLWGVCSYAKEKNLSHHAGLLNSWVCLEVWVTGDAGSEWTQFYVGLSCPKYLCWYVYVYEPVFAGDSPGEWRLMGRMRRHSLTFLLLFRISHAACYSSCWSRDRPLSVNRNGQD